VIDSNYTKWSDCSIRIHVNHAGASVLLFMLHPLKWPLILYVDVYWLVEQTHRLICDSCVYLLQVFALLLEGRRGSGSRRRGNSGSGGEYRQLSTAEEGLSGAESGKSDAGKGFVY